jgi:hypothetical protein
MLDQVRQPELELPRYRKRNCRLVSVARCGGFHHELMVHVFRLRFCPDCGEQLTYNQPLPELS